MSWVLRYLPITPRDSYIYRLKVDILTQLLTRMRNEGELAKIQVQIAQEQTDIAEGSLRATAETKGNTC